MFNLTVLAINHQIKKSLFYVQWSGREEVSTEVSIKSNLWEYRLLKYFRDDG